ncbi:hypothetical protein O3G_MSEX000374 [Manduca sexta]|nr:hypothetical protein O3G_MSEX000374 [Manduca sexta]
MTRERHLARIPMRKSRGATHSNLVICDEHGHVVGKATGPGTNHWTLGIEECAQRILMMVRDAKEDAGLPVDQPLDSLVSSIFRRAALCRHYYRLSLLCSCGPSSICFRYHWCNIYIYVVKDYF